MKIYTRTGDDGSTGLFGGDRVGKDDLRVDAYGTVDAANSAIGAALSAQPPQATAAALRIIQSKLFCLGAEVACTPGSEHKLKMNVISEADVSILEKEIDRIQDTLPELRRFILPGGTACASLLHVARTTCRAAERRVVALGREASVRAELVRYLNRLSDLLFVMAREANHAAAVAEVEWDPSA